MTRLRQALPAARINPCLAIPKDAEQKVKDERKEWEVRITELVLSAYRRKKGQFQAAPLPVILAPLRAIQAASFYIAEKVYEMRLPQFRKALKDVTSLSVGMPRDAIDKFCQLVGTKSELDPPFAQMRALFCCGDPESDGLELEADDESQLKRELEREDLWATSLSPSVLCDRNTDVEVLKAGLSQWIDLADQLHEMTGRRRSPLAAETNFVASLAFYWTDELRLSPGISHTEDYPTGETKAAKGTFTDFVRLAAEVIPGEYRRGSLEQAIGDVHERQWRN